MECDHIHASGKFPIEQMKDVKWACEDCDSKESPWICLMCGVVRCGRYVNGHAKRHAELTTGHCLCMDQALQLYCYSHDDFVINDNEYVKRLREHLQETMSFNDEEEGLPPPAKKFKSESEVNRTTGLYNLGNTCFMNAILQSLGNIDEFCGFFRGRRLPRSPLSSPVRKHHQYNTRSNISNQDMSIVYELSTLFGFLWESSNAVSPDSMLTAVWKLVPRFRGYQQQDAHEFLIYLLDQLNFELSKTSKSSSKVAELFGGILQSDVHCLVCSKHSVKQDPILDLSLDIPRNNTESSVCSLSDCLLSYTRLEQLSEANWYYCRQCKRKQPSTKQLFFKTLPPVLCIHLKRFRSNQYFRSKINSIVTFPIQRLDMSSFTAETQDKIYDLAAIVVHHGSGISSGHYTACAYSTPSRKWYHYNDSVVNEVDESWIKKCKAYILFYTCRDTVST